MSNIYGGGRRANLLDVKMKHFPIIPALRREIGGPTFKIILAIE